MKHFSRPAIAVIVGTIALAGMGVGGASAADMAVPEGQLQPPPPQYYGAPPVQESYGYPPPAAYGYPPPPPPPPYYYAYRVPPAVVLPRPYYLPRHYGPVYGGAPYRDYRRYADRGYGRYGHQWDHRYRHW